MNWIDARKQQILDEYEKRKSYEDIELRALNTQEDYQKEADALKKKFKFFEAHKAKAFKNYNEKKILLRKNDGRC